MQVGGQLKRGRGGRGIIEGQAAVGLFESVPCHKASGIFHGNGAIEP